MSEASKRCKRCGDEKPLEEFYKHGTGLHGRFPRCKPCHEEWIRERDPLYQIKRTFTSRRADAKRSGIPFSIALEDILPVPEFCPVLGVPLSHGTECGGHDNSPSIDRIIPERGYVPGNVIVISNRANRIKNNATPEEIMAVARFYERITNSGS